MERTGRILKQKIVVTSQCTVAPFRTIQERGLSEVKWELSVTLGLFKQAETPLANMEFIYMELSYTEY